ncbi:MAG: prolipoprotein diacylglyceryl transferase [Acidobacteria bacterium]|nr:prolipoprotein diacylglyceryl transferase [Acidobacteriota bacterium]
MYPELFHIGSFPINTYGVLLALAFLSALLIAAKLAARDGLPRERIYDLGLWMLLAALLGSKILMLWTEPSYRENPWHLVSLDFLRSGGVFYGGFIGALLTGYFLIRRYGLPWWKTADAFAPGIALGLGLGRQGCFAAGCCWGKPTSLPWGMRFTELGHEITGVPIDTPLHPTQLYESAAAFLIFFFLLWLHRRRRFDGQVILLFAVFYGIVRFMVEFLRDDPRGDIAGLTTLTGLSTSQMISLIIGTGSLIILIMRWRRAYSSLSPQKASTSTTKAARV